MHRSPEETALLRRFEATYDRVETPVMQAIERRVCGCDYGGNSWTTRAEADRLAATLGLGPGTRLLDLGAGSGWPGLYLARRLGCDVVLADLPANGLRIARDRAARDGLAGRVSCVVADAAALPFAAASFDAISHSDLLCCLPHKSAALGECRRLIRPGGRMVFTVISIAPGLSPAAHCRAQAHSPEFADFDGDYPAMLKATGWRLTAREDLTAAYTASCRRQIKADEDHAVALADLLGPEDFAARLGGWHDKLAALGDGLIRRDAYAAAPAPG